MKPSFESRPVRVTDRTRTEREGTNDAMIAMSVPVRHSTTNASPAWCVPGAENMGPTEIEARVATYESAASAITAASAMGTATWNTRCRLRVESMLPRRYARWGTNRGIGG